MIDDVIEVPYTTEEPLSTWIKSPDVPTEWEVEGGVVVIGGDAADVVYVAATWSGRKLQDRWQALVPISNLERGQRYNIYARVRNPLYGAGWIVMNAGVLEAQ